MIQELIVAVGVGALAVTVFVLGDRLRPESWRHTGDDAPGTLVFDLVKTFFAAMVAFMVVTCWQQYQGARSHTIAESKALVDTYWAAHAMPDPEHHRLQELVRDYTSEVVDREWSAMGRDRRLSDEAQKKLDNLRDTVYAMRSDDPTVMSMRADALSSLDRVAGARADRAMAASYRIPGFLFVALYIGSALLLISPVMSGVLVTKRSLLGMTLLGVVVGSVILQIHYLDHPFSGVNVVPKDAFEQAISRYAGITEQEHADVRQVMQTAAE